MLTALLLASTGGHLAQLHQLAPRLLAPGEPRVWATFDSPQSRSLLRGEDVAFVPYVAPRATAQIVRNVRLARDILDRHRVERLYTTGSGIALSFLPAARLRRVECHYIESAARSLGPSVTGRLARLTPGVRTYTQYPAWTSRMWRLAPSVFDDFERDPVDRRPSVSRVVVTLGTIQGYGFGGLLGTLQRLLPPGAEVLWQTGNTDPEPYGVPGVASLPAHELEAAMRRADLVVAHAGVGSALLALQTGVTPLLVPRRRRRGEHVDDHQVEIARELSARRLAVHRELEDLSVDDLLEASAGRVRRTRPAEPARY